jgi:TorA maturation chaperone TorD
MPADSIAVEMEFLGIVAEDYACSNDNYHGALAEMMDHLENWVFTFLKDMKQNAETCFYKTLASIVYNFLIVLRKDIKGVA